MSTCTTDSEYKCLTNFLWVDADCKELDDQKKKPLRVNLRNYR